MDQQIVPSSKEEEEAKQEPPETSIDDSSEEQEDDSEKTKAYYRWARSGCKSPFNINSKFPPCEAGCCNGGVGVGNIEKQEEQKVRGSAITSKTPARVGARKQETLVTSNTNDCSSTSIRPRRDYVAVPLFVHMSNHSSRELRRVSLSKTVGVREKSSSIYSRSRSTSPDSSDSDFDTPKKANTGDQGSSFFGDLSRCLIKNWPTAKRGRKRQYSGHEKTGDHSEAHTEVQKEVSRPTINNPTYSYGVGQDEFLRKLNTSLEEFEAKENLKVNSSDFASKKQKINEKAEERSSTKEHGPPKKEGTLAEVVTTERFRTGIENRKQVNVLYAGDVSCKQMTTSNPEAVGRSCVKSHKSFPSHQALGGRVSSHNKRSKDCSEITHTEISARANEPATKVTQVGDSKGEGSYQCKVCGKSFDTGQALGGHKGSHRPSPTVFKSHTTTTWAMTTQVVDPSQTAVSETPIPTSSVVTSIEPKQTDRVVLNFDLNELPDTNED
ncbi:hypothetical protein IFM89_005162 [Coptis chinensis]|uniref:C2H2-type domain-containing protein n=1 Tax=Coptis chinensis TaxID=261450 RepID=A0A835M4B7_9MAGN|nr:hypothetical protein IFM89_005162 [Coptis chinensis]